VRISDARMSGTAFGSIVLHITPEAAEGGPLGLVRTGDLVQLDTASRRIDLLVDEEELAARAAATPSAAVKEGLRGYNRLYMTEVLQADGGCDFSSFVPEPVASAPC
jgi:dihydroxy-acid dehydratase